jgi:hypothetical protein
MLNKILRLLNRFFHKSSTLNHQPLNAPSLIVIVFIDIFILVNVFAGLNDIASWHLSPEQAYPCYHEWQTYREATEPDKDYDMVSRSITMQPLMAYGEPGRDSLHASLRTSYQDAEIGHLGQVSPGCLDYASLQDALRTPRNQKNVATIAAKLTQITRLEDNNRSIRQQYDSTLLEKVAGQPRNQSINIISAEQAKQKTDTNNAAISQLKQEIAEIQKTLVTQPQALALLKQLQNQNAFEAIDAGYRHAAFWYPSIQLGFQALFLLPLIFISQAIHRFALRKNYGLVALISWHILILSTIPAFFKLFEFLQIGVFFQWVATTISRIFGGLLFLASYFQILLIPLVGFALIKLIQHLSKSGGNLQVQAPKRIVQSRCLRCAKKIHSQDIHCAHCGYPQYDQCPSCHSMTHRYMPYCTHCGAETHFNATLNRR